MVAIKQAGNEAIMEGGGGVLRRVGHTALLGPDSQNAVYEQQMWLVVGQAQMTILDQYEPLLLV